MKKKSLIVIIPALALLLTGCGQSQPTSEQPPAASQPNQQQKMPAPANTQPQATTSSEESIVGSIQDLIAKGTAMECTWSTAEDNTSMTGTMKVMGKKFRSDMKMTNTTDAQGTMDIYTVSDGEWLYGWNSMTPKQGTKMKLSELEQLGAEASKETTPQQSQQTIDLQKKMNYKCKPWSVSEADFALPGDVTFQDMTQMMKQMQQSLQQGAPSGENTACAMCQKLPDATARTNCLKSAGCQ